MRLFKHSDLFFAETRSEKEFRPVIFIDTSTISQQRYKALFAEIKHDIVQRLKLSKFAI